MWLGKEESRPSGRLSTPARPRLLDKNCHILVAGGNKRGPGVVVLSRWVVVVVCFFVGIIGCHS